MKSCNHLNSFLLPAALGLLAGCSSPDSASGGQTIVPFATDGQVKMFYDMRMHPSAVAHGDQVFITWRGARGLPQAISYDLETRQFSQQVDVFTGLGFDTDAQVYATDQHTTPVIWRDADGHLNIIAGCYGLKSFEVTPCDKVRSLAPDDITAGWERWTGPLAPSMNYAKVMDTENGGTAIFYRNGGHLGDWTFSQSQDGRSDWITPVAPVIDMNAGAAPDSSCLDFYSGSYSNARIAPDGQTMHVAFVWQQEFGSLDVWPPELANNDCTTPINPRYPDHEISQGRTRYNLYHLEVDLRSGEVVNYRGEALSTPVTRSIADNQALVLDTADRIFTLPPAIHLGADGQPQFLGVISAETPNSGWFTHIRLVDGAWQETPIVRTSNVWNAGLLDTDPDGNLRALLVVGDGEALGTGGGRTDLNNFGWGDRIEEWISPDEGATWERHRSVVPREGMRFQNLRAVATSNGQYSNDIFMLYGWEADAGPGEGVAFLWDDRR